MKLFVGLDASLEKPAICVISGHGKILKEAQVASAPEALSCQILDRDGAIAAVGLEAGPLSQWLHRGLSDAGLPVVLMETRQVKDALRAMKIKTDRRDAQGIARLLHLGWFRSVHCKSVSAQEVGRLLKNSSSEGALNKKAETSSRNGRKYPFLQPILAGPGTFSATTPSRNAFQQPVRAALSARKAVQQGLITLEMSLRGLLRDFGLKLAPYPVAGSNIVSANRRQEIRCW